jgi:predicted Rossmann fold nucleotide-binding protein DprA/Smf involved in DNA uptake
MTEQEAYIALNMMEKVGPVGVRSLAAVLGSVSAIFNASSSDLQQADGIGIALASSIIKQRDTLRMDEELVRAENSNTHIITPLDEEYPDALREIHDPPLALYVRGSLRPTDKNSIAVVGTRRATHYGMDTTRKIRKIYPDLPIIVQTAYAQISDRKMALDCGCNDYIVKQVGPYLGAYCSRCGNWLKWLSNKKKQD